MADLDEDILAVRQGRSDTLDLSWERFGVIRELPDQVRNLERLRELRLVGAGLAVLPSWLMGLQLEHIDLRGCPVGKFPPMPWVRWTLDVDQFYAFRAILDTAQVIGVAIGPGSTSAAIQHLAVQARLGRLSLTQLIVEIPRWELPTAWRDLSDLGSHLETVIGHSPRLRELRVADCPLGRVPWSIRELSGLAALTLSGVRPAELPDWLFRLPALRTLDLSGNRLAELPAALAEAAELVELDLRGNPLPEIPDSVWELRRLAVLDLRECPLQQVPADVLRLAGLRELRVDAGRPELAVPPPEVTARGLAAIKSYWQHERASGTDYLSEAKLVIVGEPGAGKTTLAKKIIEPGYPADPNEDSTHGIGILLWQFGSALRIPAAEGEQFIPRDFRVNLWDFGGQEIYHSTHQFFLTKRSVYVLVCDGRREDTDFQYWLESVDLLSDGSPLIIVQNRRQGRAQELDLRTLRQDYPNLVGALTVDLSSNEGLPELIAKVRRELELLPHVGTPLPKTWQDVRLALEGDPRAHISAEEFFGICARHGFARRDDMRQLGGFLHDLGICLFFQEDPLLGKTVIRQPEWGTTAVYRVLDDPEIAAGHGVFGPADLRRVWHDPTYESMHAELVQLMAKFALCFPVPGTDQYVAPQLLATVRPAYAWDEPDDLVLRYEYDVMPKGILHRLIVELHDLIEEGAVWRTGVVFRHGAGRAEVIEDRRRGRLRIRLAPRDARVMFAVLDRALNTIHRSYADLRFDRLRPCGCEVCADAAEPTMFSMRELEEFARAGDPIQCRKSRRLVDAAALLSELWQPGGESRRPAASREVFVSYKWGGAADVLVDWLVEELGKQGLLITRDRNVVNYRDSIQQFMRRMGRSNRVIVVIDDAYLKSKTCMFELTEIADRTDFAKSIFPIVLPDANIFDGRARLEYVRHWEQQRDQLEEAMRTVRQENLQGIREELDLYQKIRTMVAGITAVLADMNTRTVSDHLENAFGDLLRSL